MSFTIFFSGCWKYNFNNLTVCRGLPGAQINISILSFSHKLKMFISGMMNTIPRIWYNKFTTHWTFHQHHKIGSSSDFLSHGNTWDFFGHWSLTFQSCILLLFLPTPISHQLLSLLSSRFAKSFEFSFHVHYSFYPLLINFPLLLR